jgi:2-methylisocitrate lyase-like PEP mutase family enzyme
MAQDETLDRAHAYCGAGADAILIHSRNSKANEILEFTRAWQDRLPMVIVPTRYFKTPAYRDAGVSTVIWANHNMRAAVAARRNVCRLIRDGGWHRRRRGRLGKSRRGIRTYRLRRTRDRGGIVSVEEVFGAE